MKCLYFLLFSLLMTFGLTAQSDKMVIEIQKDTLIEDMKCCEMKVKPSHWLTADFRSYLSPARGTVTDLSAEGFVLDEQATEIGVKFGRFPKIYYYQQLGTLTNGNYSSIFGLGLKEKYQRDFIKNPSIVLAPYIEVGAGFYQLSVTKNVSSNGFNSALNGQVVDTKLDNFSITGDLGLNLGFAFDILGTNTMIAVHGGYLTNLPSNWKTGHSLAFKEKLDLSSFYYGGKLSISLLECCGM